MAVFAFKTHLEFHSAKAVFDNTLELPVCALRKHLLVGFGLLGVRDQVVEDGGWRFFLGPEADLLFNSFLLGSEQDLQAFGHLLSVKVGLGEAFLELNRGYILIVFAHQEN